MDEKGLKYQQSLQSDLLHLLEIQLVLATEVADNVQDHSGLTGQIHELEVRNSCLEASVLVREELLHRWLCNQQRQKPLAGEFARREGLGQRAECSAGARRRNQEEEEEG